MELKSAVLLLTFCISSTLIVVPASSDPPYYHAEGNVNYPGSYFESTYIERGIGVDDYIAIIDLAFIFRAWGSKNTSEPWGIDWDLFNPDADVAGFLGPPPDGQVDLDDLVWVVAHLGLNYHDPPPSDKKGLTKVKVNVFEPLVHVDEEFLVAIEIKTEPGIGINAYEAKLSWDDPALIEGVEAFAGGFLPDVTFVSFMGPNYIYVGGCLEDPGTVGGTGTLAGIILRCKGATAPPLIHLDLSSNLYDNGLHFIPHKDKSDSVAQLP